MGKKGVLAKKQKIILRMAQGTYLLYIFTSIILFIVSDKEAAIPFYSIGIGGLTFVFVLPYLAEKGVFNKKDTK